MLTLLVHDNWHCLVFSCRLPQLYKRHTPLLLLLLHGQWWGLNASLLLSSMWNSNYARMYTYTQAHKRAYIHALDIACHELDQDTLCSHDVMMRYSMCPEQCQLVHHIWNYLILSCRPPQLHKRRTPLLLLLLHGQWWGLNDSLCPLSCLDSNHTCIHKYIQAHKRAYIHMR
jgi:hypothetical protein